MILKRYICGFKPNIIELMTRLFSLKEKINLAQCETLGIEVTEVVYTLEGVFQCLPIEAYLQHAHF